ncbi:MAG: hypothetical protein RLZZ308_422 [Candidatus Parcubacteria bacterium]|jgi:hypothetical protein
MKKVFGFFALCVVAVTADAQIVLHKDASVSSVLPTVRVFTDEFRQGEGCLEGFRRIGKPVTLKDCIKAAEEAGIRIMAFVPPNGPTVIIVPVSPGDPFAIIYEQGQEPLVKLYKAPH